MSTGVGSSRARRVYLHLKHQIVSGDVSTCSRLPAEPALANDHGVSRATVRRALDQLERENLIVRRPGSGTFVKSFSSAGRIVADFANVFTHLAEMGRRTEVRLMSFGYVQPTADVAAALGVKVTDSVQRAVRLRLMDGEPFSYLVTHVPEHIGKLYTEADLSSTPLLELLERSGMPAQTATQTIGAAQACPEVAQLLSTELAAALLSVTRVVKGANEQGIEHLYALYHPERYTLQMELQRTGNGGARRWAAASPPR